MKTKINKLMAYFYMPLIFTVVGLGILYVALAPVFDVVVSVSAMVVADDIPSFSTELKTIFKEPDVEDVNEQSKTISIKEVEWPKYGSHYANITCERIKLKAPLYMGDNKKILKAGAGQYLGSFIPGYGRPLLLAAHCTTFFAPLQHIKKDDVVTIKTSYGVYQYKVYEITIVDPPFDKAVDLAKDEEELMMYTCYPFQLLSGSRHKRMFVYAKKIVGPDLID